MSDIFVKGNPQNVHVDQFLPHQNVSFDFLFPKRELTKSHPLTNKIRLNFEL